MDVIGSSKKRFQVNNITAWQNECEQKLVIWNAERFEVRENPGRLKTPAWLKILRSITKILVSFGLQKFRIFLFLFVIYYVFMIYLSFPGQLEAYDSYIGLSNFRSFCRFQRSWKTKPLCRPQSAKRRCFCRKKIYNNTLTVANIILIKTVESHFYRFKPILLGRSNPEVWLKKKKQFKSDVCGHTLFCFFGGTLLIFLVFFRRAEPSLFAHGLGKLISFFPVRDIPLRFIALNPIFSAPIGRNYPIFVHNTTTGSRFIILQNFGRRKIFSASY